MSDTRAPAYEPPDGLRFFDSFGQEWMLSGAQGEDVWLFKRHQDGQWVSVHRANESERALYDSMDGRGGLVLWPRKGGEG